jgi:signal transduction histidine kinase
MARYNQASGGVLVALTVAGFLVWATGTALWRMSVVLGIVITLIGGTMLVWSLTSAVGMTRGRILGVTVPMSLALVLLSQGLVQPSINARTVLVTLGLLCIIVAFTFIVKQRSKSEREAAALKHSEQRRQLASEVHDVVGHTLSATMLHITAARLAVPTDPQAAIASLELAEKHGRHSMRDVRSVVKLLRSDDPDPANGILVADDLDSLVTSLREAGAHIDYSPPQHTPELPAIASLTIFRVVQEGLTNAVRHGNGPISLSVSYTSDCAQVRISNTIGDGQPTFTKGIGLSGMRDRVQGAGGQLEVGPSATDREWLVLARLPI